MKKITHVTPEHIKRIIAEEREILLEHQRYKKMVLSEGLRMHREGYSPQQINEGMLNLIKGLGEKFIQSIKWSIAEWILRKIGMKTHKWGWKVIMNVFEEMEIMNFRKYLGPDGCEELTKLVFVAIGETGVEDPMNGLIDGIGVEPTGRAWVVLREQLTQFILEGEIGRAISDAISDWICNINISSLYDAISGGDAEAAEVILEPDKAAPLQIAGPPVS